MEKAKRLVEHKRDVIILLDSITRLARAYNTVVPSSGKVLTGGVDANALQRPKRFFGAARNIEQGGSLTIIATALIETGSADGRSHLRRIQRHRQRRDRAGAQNLADKRIFPVDRYPEIRHAEGRACWSTSATLSKMWVLRRILNPMGTVDAVEFLLDKMKDTKNNDEFFRVMNQ